MGRARLFDSERFKHKFVTTLADLRGKVGFLVRRICRFEGVKKSIALTTET
jgi:hypothetical protein